MKRRIDQLLTERGLAESRHKAQALLLAGQVLVDEQKVEKPGKLVDEAATIRLLGQLRFVSRAGAKLAAALDHFQITVADLVCADLGASTGGFTDCLLQRGARAVYAYDVGKGQLAWKLQRDARVVVRDECNVRNLAAADLPADLGFVCMDLSFISLTKILLPLRAAIRQRLGVAPDVAPKAANDVSAAVTAMAGAGTVAGNGDACAARAVTLIALVKPQFEAERGEVGKGGVIRSPAIRRRTLETTAAFAVAHGYEALGDMESPLPGAEGNVEYLLWLRLIV